MDQITGSIDDDDDPKNDSFTKETFQNNIYVMSPKRIKDAKRRSLDGNITLRFPPEPSGYLHLGHAKAIFINFETANFHEGKCLLRYDDTNPRNAKIEYYDGINDMIEWLGYEPSQITYASDNFQILYEKAVELINCKNAYVCHQKQERGKHKSESPYQYRTVEENLLHFDKMKEGEYVEEEAVLRIKLKSSGILDPVIYRIIDVPHCRTKNKWKIYPTYGFAHCICDSLEGIAVSLCTEEFSDHKLLYN